LAEPLGELRVRASVAQAQRLLEWAAAWPQRTWAIEGAGGLGHLLGQQLLAAGERVLDVQPKLGALAVREQPQCCNDLRAVVNSGDWVARAVPLLGRQPGRVLPRNGHAAVRRPAAVEHAPACIRQAAGRLANALPVPV
jgi:hypothetical protein